MVERSGGGIVVPPGDARGVADAILQLYDDPERCSALGRTGRKYVEKNYSRAAWASLFEKEISGIGAIPSPGAEVAILQGEASASPNATD